MRNGAVLGINEAKLWGADTLRNNMDAAEYKHVVLEAVNALNHAGIQDDRAQNWAQSQTSRMR